jgi:hypothetical protein
VIHPPSPPQKTYWVLSAHDAIDEARNNLAKREGSPASRVHFALRDRICDPAAPIEETIHRWLRDRSGVDAAIWTGLSATLRGADVVQEALAHVSALEAVPEDHARAKRYVVKAPQQIQTAVRRALQQRGWSDEPLPADLFEE